MMKNPIQIMKDRVGEIKGKFKKENKNNSAYPCTQKNCKQVFQQIDYFLNVHSSTMYNSQKVEIPRCSSTDEWIMLLDPSDGLSFIHKKKKE